MWEKIRAEDVLSRCSPLEGDTFEELVRQLREGEQLWSVEEARTITGRRTFRARRITKPKRMPRPEDVVKFCALTEEDVRWLRK